MSLRRPPGGLESVVGLDHGHHPTIASRQGLTPPGCPAKTCSRVRRGVCSRHAALRLCPARSWAAAASVRGGHSPRALAGRGGASTDPPLACTCSPRRSCRSRATPRLEAEGLNDRLAGAAATRRWPRRRVVLAGPCPLRHAPPSPTPARDAASRRRPRRCACPLGRIRRAHAGTEAHPTGADPQQRHRA